MRHCLVFALGVLVFAVAAPGAFATRVIFDPPSTPSPIVCTQNSPCNIELLNHTYTVDFLPCSDVQGVTVPSEYTYCLWMNNVTNHALADFTFTFIVPAGGSASGDQLTCDGIPADTVTDDCPDSLPAPGSLFTASFFSNPPIQNPVDFYLFTDFLTSPGTANLTVAVPEPGEMGLFGLGLLALGLCCALQRRRR